jgi:hypothetical protein
MDYLMRRELCSEGNGNGPCEWKRCRLSKMELLKIVLKLRFKETDS